MKTRLGILFFSVFISNFIFAAIPSHSGKHISDYANIIDDADERLLNDSLYLFEKATGNQIVVLTVRSLEDQDVESYALEVFKKWQIGQAKHDNGVLLLISSEDRKMKIEVGYGLEGDLTDSEAGVIIRRIIVPYFKNKQYSAGVKEGVFAIVNQVKGYQGLPNDKPLGIGNTLLTIVLLFFCQSGSLTLPIHELTQIPYTPLVLILS